MAKLVIKYQGDYIVEDNNKKFSLIDVPVYYLDDDYANISIFIELFCGGILNNDYSSIIGLNYVQGLNLSEDFFYDEVLSEIDERVYLYDLDALVVDSSFELKEVLTQNLKRMPKKLVRLCDIPEEKLPLYDDLDDEVPIKYEPRYVISDELNNIIKMLDDTKSMEKDKNILLLYSGGKDSTLSAIRLVNLGYNVYFIHFDNGSMLDSDKPYLTWKKAFLDKDGYYFPYKYASINIRGYFESLFNDWKERFGDTLEDGTMTSEIRCLACRSAMYLKTIEIAKKEGFRYIADGARISQKFMLEQIPMTLNFKMLAGKYGIEVLYPVLYLEDDSLEKNEIIENGFSSKSWESKCLLGRSAMDKTPEDEEQILDYYDNTIYPMLMRILKRRIGF